MMRIRPRIQVCVADGDTCPGHMDKDGSTDLIESNTDPNPDPKHC